MDDTTNKALQEVRAQQIHGLLELSDAHYRSSHPEHTMICLNELLNNYGPQGKTSLYCKVQTLCKAHNWDQAQFFLSPLANDEPQKLRFMRLISSRLGSEASALVFAERIVETTQDDWAVWDDTPEIQICKTYPHLSQFLQYVPRQQLRKFFQEGAPSEKKITKKVKKHVDQSALIHAAIKLADQGKRTPAYELLSFIQDRNPTAVLLLAALCFNNNRFRSANGFAARVQKMPHTQAQLELSQEIIKRIQIWQSTKAFCKKEGSRGTLDRTTSVAMPKAAETKPTLTKKKSVSKTIRRSISLDSFELGLYNKGLTVDNDIKEKNIESDHSSSDESDCKTIGTLAETILGTEQKPAPVQSSVPRFATQLSLEEIENRSSDDEIVGSPRTPITSPRRLTTLKGATDQTFSQQPLSPNSPLRAARPSGTSIISPRKSTHSRKGSVDSDSDELSIWGKKEKPFRTALIPPLSDDDDDLVAPPQSPTSGSQSPSSPNSSERRRTRSFLARAFQKLTGSQRAQETQLGTSPRSQETAVSAPNTARDTAITESTAQSGSQSAR